MNDPENDPENDPDFLDIVTILRSPDRVEPYTCNAAADEIEQLRKERDDLRWQVCELSSNGSIDDAMREAKERGWA